MDAVASLARQHRLKIIEDCAHAPGARYQSRQGPRPAGTLGDVGCFSFFSNKNLTTGEGGLVVTNDDALAATIKYLRSHGMTTLTWDRHRGHSFSYDVVGLGYNYRLDEMRAALGLVQLQRLEGWNRRRQELTGQYRRELGQLRQLSLPFAQAPTGSTHHLFPVLLPPGSDRARFMASLAARGVQTSVHYPPIHRFSYYGKMWPPGYDHRLPHTEAVAAREVTLPLFPTMTPAQLDLVVQAVRNAAP
jgi:dTDP-4-amino-4,6-dideoxygalactose transaminase